MRIINRIKYHMYVYIYIYMIYTYIYHLYSINLYHCHEHVSFKKHERIFPRFFHIFDPQVLPGTFIPWFL